MSRLCFFVIAFVFSLVRAQDYELNLAFTRSGSIPDVKYPNSAYLDPNDVLTPTQVKDIPLMTWDYELDKFYTVVKTDPDAPSREKPTYREFLHWLVVNVPGDNVGVGETIAQYIGAGPAKDTGMHRYVFLVYEQPYKMLYDEPRLSDRSMANRSLFSVSKFAMKYNLGDPIAGTFYQAEYDDYVPTLYRQLGVGGAVRNASSVRLANIGQQSTLNCYVMALTAAVMVLTLMK